MKKTLDPPAATIRGGENQVVIPKWTYLPTFIFQSRYKVRLIMSSQDLQESTKSTRMSLKTLQHTASDRENLVGRPTKNLKHQLSQENVADVEVKRKNLSTKETQANLDTNITVEDLTNPEASEKYWKILAEKRRVALQEALEENEKLHKLIAELKKENLQTKQMLEEANSFIEIVKEELSNTNDDTGIDVNDVSNLDDTANEGDTTADE
ncbi:geminin isoform X2 [Amyelois transitella]|uniref:geminin isoform X2 n=1 Tax=Amyelois transitella TaxID=680683 RepID=UPI00299055B3|nr:geminin isoform X2 [Amyelois transitella]